MPTSLAALALLIVLLGPGFCFVAARERKYPARRQSSFRESVDIAAASILLNIFVIGAFALVRVFLPHESPNVGALFSEPHKYFLDNYRSCIGWGMGIFAAACALGFVSGNWIKPGRGSVDASAWWEMFEFDPSARKFVGCQLLDGSYVSGELYSYSTACDETDDRELVLSEPSFLASGESGNPTSLESDLTSISAKRILFVSTNYVRPNNVEIDKDRLTRRMREAWNILRRGSGVNRSAGSAD